MNTVFHKRFEEEFLVSEKLRTKILVCVFSIAATGAAILLFFFKYFLPVNKCFHHLDTQQIFIWYFHQVFVE